MSNDIYIHDDFGNRIPLLDAYGNLSFEVIMLYSEDKLTAADRKAVDDFAATDEMSRDALDGYALTRNSSKTRHQVGQVNAGIQKISGAKAVSTFSTSSNDFDYRKLAAAVTLLVIVAGATYFGSQFFGDEKMADNSVAKEEFKRTEEVVREFAPSPLLSDSIISEDPNEIAGKLEKSIDETDVMDDLKSVAIEKPVIETEVADAELEVQSDAFFKDQMEPEMAASSMDAISESIVGYQEQEVDEDAAGLAQAQDKREVLEEVEVEEAEKKDLSNEERARLQQELERYERMAVASNQEESAKQEAETQALQAAEMAGADYELADVVVVERQKNVSAMKAKESIVESLEANAKFPGGDLEMYRFIENTKNYSDAMIDEDLKGAVVVSFQIDKNGKVAKPKIESGQTGLLADDAIRVIQSMPSWEPAKKANGNAIKSERSVTIRYGE